MISGERWYFSDGLQEILLFGECNGKRFSITLPLGEWAVSQAKDGILSGRSLTISSSGSWDNPLLILTQLLESQNKK